MWAYALLCKEFNNESNKNSPTIKNKRSFYSICLEDEPATTVSKSARHHLNVAEQVLPGRLF